jgi:hypothetical protein
MAVQEFHNLEIQMVITVYENIYDKKLETAAISKMFNVSAEPHQIKRVAEDPTCYFTWNI